MKKKGIRVAVGMSGGVDSSVAAALLLENGYDVIGITMEKYDDSVLAGIPEIHSCFSPMEKENINAVSDICDRLGIPLHVIDLREEFKTHVIDYFRNAYLSGKTPNPCVVCNEKVKFGFLVEKAESLNIDFQYFATGHYVRIAERENTCLLQVPVDVSKDQTYFLYRLNPAQLSRILFPLGAYKKSHVRELAHAMKLGISGKPESQDFMGGRGYTLLFDNQEKNAGNIVNESGDVLGTHKGIIHYTVGQRKGLGVAAATPLYVVRIDRKNNLVVVAEKDRLYSKGLTARDVVLYLPEKTVSFLKVKARIRSTHKPAEAELLIESDNRAKLIFNDPQLAVTPGQSVVFYSEGLVLGGGVIDKAFN